MKILTAFIFFFVSFSTSEISADKIPWSDSYKLTWNDFRGSKGPGTGFVASTSSGISFSYSVKTMGDDIDYTYSVESNFFPDESWYDPKHASDYILGHEQTHFDITEIHARRMRKILSETTFTKNIKSEMQTIYQKIDSQRRGMQDAFDSETEHSKNKAMEYKWEDFVAEQLLTYEQWK